MMLWLLVVTVAAAALAASPSVPEQLKTIYEEGKEYIYKYESQVLSGMPLGSRIYSGLKVKGEIRLQKITILEMKMELRNPRLYKVNGPIKENDPTKEMLPDDILIELMDKDATDMKSKLVHPVKFSYMRGHVEDLITERDDPDWSVNIKKGILSLLEINFNDRHSLSPDVDVTDAEIKPKLYRVVEPSVSGECETAYRLRTERSREGTPSMDITKVRNLNKCIEKVVLSQSMLNGKPCDKMSEVVTPQSGVRYTLLGSPDEYIIVSAVGESQYNIIPHEEKQGRLSTLANQTLVLIDSHPITDQIPDHAIPSPAEPTLTAKLPRPHQRKIHRSKQDQLEDVKMVKKALTGIDKLTQDKVQEEVTVLLKDLHRLLEKLDKQSLKSILADLDKDNSKLPRARKVLLDMLPMVGTDAAVDVLLERVEMTSASPTTVTLSLMALGMLPQPDIPIVKRLMDYMIKKEGEKVKVNPLVRRTAYLSLASLGHKLMKKNSTEIEDLKDQERILRMLLDVSNERQLRIKLEKELNKIKDTISQTKELYKTAKESIIEIVEKLYRSSEEESKLLALKTMGGLRYPEFLTKLSSIAEDKESPVVHRLEAIVGLKQLARHMPLEVRKILLPVYYDQSEDEEIRGLAVLSAITTDLPKPELEMVGRSLQDEPSDHISTLVSSALTELSNFTSPCQCVKQMSINSSLALHYAKKPKPGLHLSKMVVKSVYDKELQMGQVYEQVLLYSSRERLPRAAAMHLTSITQSSAFSLLKVGYKAKGLDGVLDKVLTDSDIKGVSGLLKKILHPEQEDNKVTKTDQNIKDVKKKVEMKPRKPEPLEGHVFVKMLDQELIYFDLKSLLPESTEKKSGLGAKLWYLHMETYVDTIVLHQAHEIFIDNPSTLLNTLKSKVDPMLPEITALVDLVKKLMNTQLSLVLPVYIASLPTETGLPIHLLSKLTSVVKLQGDIRITLDPKSSQKKSMLSKFDTDVDLKLSGVMDSTMDMMAELNLIQSGVSVRSKASADLPTKMVINVDPDKDKLLLKIKDQKKQELLKLTQKPVAVTKLLPELAEKYPTVPEETDIELMDDAEIKTVSYDVGETYLGRKLSLVGVRAVRRDNGLSLPTISGRQVLTVMYDPLLNKDLNIQFQHITEKVEVVSVSNKVEPKQKSSWWPFWASASSDSAPAQVTHNNEDDDDTVISEAPAKGFIDLEEEDLTVDYLQRKFRKDTEILKSPNKCGLVIRLVDPEPHPKHNMQLTTLYQGGKESTKHMYSIELRRNPVPGEKKDWKLVTNMKVEMPDKPVEPSDLLDNEYQHNIEKQIQQVSSEPKERVDTLLDLKSYTLLQDIQQLDPHSTRRVPSRLLHSILDHLMGKDVGPSSKSLKDLVQKQRKLSKDINNLKKQDIKPENKEIYLKTLRDLMEKSKSGSQKVLDELHTIHLSQQRPEEAIPILYIVTSNTKISKRLRYIQQTLTPLLLHSEEINLGREIQEVVKKHQTLQETQQRHSIEKQPTEKDKSKLEVNPNDRDFYEKLQILEKKLIDLKSEHTVSKLQEKLQDTLKVAARVNELLYDSMKDSISISKMIRMKVVEILYHKKLALSDLKIPTVDQTQASEVLTEVRPQSAPKDYVVQNKLLKLRDQLNHEAVRLIHRLLISVDADKDLQSLVSFSSPLEIESLKSLQRLRLLQMTLTEKLEQLSHSDTVLQPSESLDDIIDKVRNIPIVVNMDLDRALKDDKKSTAGPVALRSLRILARQCHIVNKVMGLVREKILTKVTTDVGVEKELKQLEDINKLKEELIKLIEVVEKSSASTGETEEPEHLTLLKKVIQLEAKQLKLQATVRDVLECLNRPDKPSPDDPDTIRCKKLVYDVITQASHVQDKLITLSLPVQKQLKDLPRSKPVNDLLNMLLKKQKKQLHTIRQVEDTLKEKTTLDTSLLQPLQVLQQVKDKAHRFEVKIKSLKRDPKTLSDSTSPDLVPAIQAVDIKAVNKPLKITVTVTYGELEDTQKMLHILLLGKKSLEQLLWEKDQVLPDKQDSLVRAYLQDAHVKDDRTAEGYSEIKDELNMYRHLHLLASYEDSLPMTLRELSWKMHELVKLVYYKKVSLIMPDDTNLPNTVDIKLDVKRDNKWVDMEIKNAYETTLLRNLEVPALCPVVAVAKNKPIKEQLIRSVTGVSSTYRCEVSPDRIKTMLGAKYEVQRDHDQCERILTADCSSSDKLVILNNPSQQLLKILIPGHKVEVSVSTTSDVEVHVDKVKKHLLDPVVVESQIQIHKLSEKQVEVRLLSLGVSVVTDGKKHTIKVSKVPSLQLCGLCGDPMSSPVTDLMGPQLVTLHQHPGALLTTYLLPSPKCDVKKLQQQHNVIQLRKLAKLVKPVEKTLVHLQDKNGKTCFSKLPVKSCPPGSKPESTESVLVPFYCLRSKNSKVDKLLLLVKTKVIDEYRFRRTSVNLYKPVPTDCVKE